MGASSGLHSGSPNYECLFLFDVFLQRGGLFLDEFLFVKVRNRQRTYNLLLPTTEGEWRSRELPTPSQSMPNGSGCPHRGATDDCKADRPYYGGALSN